MAKEPTRTQVANKVVEVVQGVDEIPARRIDDIPKDFARADGAREIAVLTLTAISHDFEFKPVMDALEKLAALKDWSHEFFVAHVGRNKRPTFDWREAPQRKYESFKDFYAQELERTFGSWENLQHTWAEVAKGKITEAEGRRIILRGHGRKVELGDNDDVTKLKPKEANTKIHILARLDEDRPDLAAKVRAETMSANAAAIEAGYRKKRERKKLSAFEKHINALEKLSDSDQRRVRRYLNQKFDPIDFESARPDPDQIPLFP